MVYGESMGPVAASDGSLLDFVESAENGMQTVYASKGSDADMVLSGPASAACVRDGTHILHVDVSRCSCVCVLSWGAVWRIRGIAVLPPAELMHSSAQAERQPVSW